MKDFKNKKQQGIAQRNNSKTFPRPLRNKGNSRNAVRQPVSRAQDLSPRPLRNKGNSRNAVRLVTLFPERSEGEREKTLDERSEFSVLGVGYNPSTRKAAFTLAEVLITLAVIGIVAVLTISALVKNNNEKAWNTAKDVFSKRLDVAMKAMNTEGTLTGYTTTADFVNALKKNIKINQVCTDDVTKCFAKNITFGKYNPQVVNITNNALTLYTDAGQDWAETVGVRFANGVNALIAYNKNCSDDPYNNQYSPSASCIGIVYDVQANKKPNTYGKDIDVNQNISKIAGKGLCEYELADGEDTICFTKILGPQNGGYSPITKAECEGQKDKLGIKACNYDNDYWAGAVAACGGVNKLPNYKQLTALAREVFNDPSITYTSKNGLTLDKEKSAPFLAQSPLRDFGAWSREERDATCVYILGFHSNSLYFGNYHPRATNDALAVCVDTEE